MKLIKNIKNSPHGAINPSFFIIVAVFLVIMLLPLGLSKVFPIFQLLIMGYFSLVVFMFVRNILGNSILTYVVSALLIYILVIKLMYLFATFYMLYLIGSMFLSGLIIFGLQKH